ncbi:MAG: hypothetical protein KBD48_01900 [Candidatus Pacebacteria bacterium]|nr:hypothetical protein [Candidatus Paceibacterota bacterium]MBP9715919.1 hypothetical protein [Candidatus Paceibacterota bacterium]
MENKPIFRSIQTEANTIKEAIEKLGGNPAGDKDFDWVLANPIEARKMLKEDNVGYYFPNTLSKNQVSYLFWDKGEFLVSAEEIDYEWNPFNRIVLLD